MAKNVNRNLGKRLKMVLPICEQEREIAELMIMRHGLSRDEARATQYDWHRDRKQVYITRELS